MKSFDINERVNQAVAYFKDGYNCSQSVFMAYADLFDIDHELAKKMSVSFGGGLGRMREVCGTVSGMSMLAGFKYPVNDPKDQQARTRNYAMVQKMAGLFKEKYGTIICKDLLAAKKQAAATDPEPTIRDKEFYAKRPCARLVAESATIAGRMIKGELED